MRALNQLFIFIFIFIVGSFYSMSHQISDQTKIESEMLRQKNSNMEYQQTAVINEKNQENAIYHILKKYSTNSNLDKLLQALDNPFLFKNQYVKTKQILSDKMSLKIQDILDRVCIQIMKSNINPQVLERYLARYYSEHKLFFKSLSSVVANGSGSISGTVTDMDGAPIENVEVHCYNEPYTYSQYNLTDSNGFYSFTGLEDGNYYIDFYSTDYLFEYYNNTNSYYEREVIVLSSGQEITDINADLLLGGKIKGTVTDEQGNPIPDVSIICRDKNYTFYEGAYTDSDGNYIANRIPEGECIVYFTKQGYTIIYYDNRESKDDADTLNISYGQIISNIDAVLSTGGSISGKVTNDNGTGINNIWVTCYNTNQDTASFGYTDAEGNYSLSGLFSKDYIVRFEDFSETYLSEFYNDKFSFQDADRIAVIKYEETSGINVTLQQSSSISGTVTDSLDNPIASTSILCYDSNDSYTNSGYTDSEGYYVVGGLRSDNYKIKFNPTNSNFIPEYYDDKPNIESADTIFVDQGTQVEQINAVLTTGGSISGKITDENGDPLKDTEIDCYDEQNNYVKSVYSEENGNYTIIGLDSGSYKLYIYIYNSDYLPEYYNNKDTLDTADLISVQEGQDTPEIDVSLNTGASISGKITDDSGNPIENVEVRCHLESSVEYFARYASSDSEGNYMIRGLKPGSYTLQFVDWDFNYLSEYYNNQRSGWDADLITVENSDPLSGYDAQLSPAGRITGTVTDSDMHPLESISVLCYNTQNGYIGSGYTNENGEYTLGNLETGSYKVRFNPYNNNYVTQVYNNQINLDNGDIINVTAGETVEGINGVLDPASSISGHVTDRDGIPLYNIDIALYNNDKDEVIKYAYTNDQGYYTLTQLTGGTYYVGFFPTYNSNYNDIYYDNKSTLEQADALLVGTGENITGINAILPKGGTISGLVTDQLSNPLSDVEVSLYDSEKQYVNWTQTDENGAYEFTGIQPGNYYVGFNCYYSHNHLANQFYNDKEYFDNADIINVQLGEVYSNINAILNEEGSISGTVVDSNGDPIQGITVNVQGELNTSKSAITNELGEYRVSGLPEQNYTVYFDGFEFYISEYYDNVSHYWERTLVYVNYRQETENINTTIDTGGGIYGIVTDPDGVPLENINIYFNGNNFYGTTTDENGAFSIKGILPGDYILEYNSIFNYQSEYYENESDYYEATSISIGSDDYLEFNAVLEFGSTIKGSVKNEAGDPLRYVYIKLYDLNNNYTKFGWADYEGNFSIPALKPGIYKLFVDTEYTEYEDYISEWYLDSDSFDNATEVLAPRKKTTEGIDFILGRGGIFKGSVKDSMNNFLQNIHVMLFDTNENMVSTTDTDSEGNYLFSDLNAGDYVLYFDTTSTFYNYYMPEYYNNQLTFASASIITANPVGTINNLDAVLDINSDSTMYLNYNIPHIDVNGYWKTYIVFDNTSDNFLDATVILYDESNPYLHTFIPVTVAPQVQFKLELETGSAGKIITDLANQNLFVRESFFHTGQLGIAEFNLSSESSQHIFFTMPQYNSDNLSWMGFAAMNTGTDTAQIQGTAFDFNGLELETVNFDILPFSKKSETLESIFENTDFRDISRISLTSDSFLSGINISGDNVSKLLFTRAAIQNTPTLVYSPHIAQEREYWDNFFIFDNTNDSSAFISIVYYSNGAIMYEDNFEVGSRETLNYNINSVFEVSEILPDSAIITSDIENIIIRQSFINKSQGGIAEFNLTNHAGATIFYNFPAYLKEELNWMGMALFNCSESSQSITLDAYYDGAIVQTATLELEPFNQTSGILEDFFSNLTYMEIDRVKVTGSDLLSGINISGYNQERLLFSPALLP